jgi:hypothetical protein
MVHMVIVVTMVILVIMVFKIVIGNMDITVIRDIVGIMISTVRTPDVPLTTHTKRIKCTSKTYLKTYLKWYILVLRLYNKLRMAVYLKQEEIVLMPYLESWL